jgi:hypothetical protein
MNPNLGGFRMTVAEIVNLTGPEPPQYKSNQDV